MLLLHAAEVPRSRGALDNLSDRRAFSTRPLRLLPVPASPAGAALALPDRSRDSFSFTLLSTRCPCRAGGEKMEGCFACRVSRDATVGISSARRIPSLHMVAKAANNEACASSTAARGQHARNSVSNPPSTMTASHHLPQPPRTFTLLPATARPAAAPDARRPTWPRKAQPARR